MWLDVREQRLLFSAEQTVSLLSSPKQGLVSLKNSAARNANDITEVAFLCGALLQAQQGQIGCIP